VTLWLLLLALARPVQHPSFPRSVLWVGAHPDDESIAAPLLAKWCRDEGVRCTFLIATRGDAGPCLLPGGCAPDVAAIRSAEAADAARFFNAQLILLSLPDGGPWPDDVIGPYIEAVQPDLVLTFDPEHGTTGHPDHKRIGAAVLAATNRPVWLLETRIDVTSDPFAIRFSPARADAQRFYGDWNAVLEDMRRHPSQFDAQWLAAVENVPPQDRAVWFSAAGRR
jgi:LmbE family N-acetylglucosaminyl deacetylase